MRILLGGSTFIQAGEPKRRQIIKIDVPRSIVDTLRAMGHEVDWRIVQLGEDLTKYDVVWMCLAPINSLNARKNALGATWALGQTNVARVALWDDWQVRQVQNAWRNVAKMHMGQYTKYLASSNEWFYPEAPQETIAQYADQITATCQGLLGPLWETGIVSVVPAYRWGDRSIIRQHMPNGVGPIWALDPTPTVVDDILMSVEPSTEKERRWTMAGLMPHDKWLGKLPNEWPIDLFGSIKLKGERLRTEQQVIAEYNTRWGALSPPYFSAGSGWWRSRFLYAARVGSVLVCDKGEGASLGRAYNVKIPDVERASDDGLLNMAMEQRNALRPYLTTMDHFRADLTAILTDALHRQETLRTSSAVLSQA